MREGEVACVGEGGDGYVGLGGILGRAGGGMGMGRNTFGLVV